MTQATAEAPSALTLDEQQAPTARFARDGAITVAFSGLTLAMNVVTGVLIGFVLVVMVGQTVRTMQGTGWVPITPLEIDLPYWPGLWLGVYPTVETIGAQIGAAVFVIGSYFLAQEMKVKGPRRKRARAAASAAPAATEGAIVDEVDEDAVVAGAEAQRD